MEQNPVIDIRGLSVNYDKKRVLTNIYLDVTQGGVYGVIGPNGAGKSTLFKSILGLTEIASGTIKIFGESIDQVRHRIAYVPQKEEIDWDFPASVLDIVLTGRTPFIKLFKSMTKADRSIALDALEQLGISDLANRQIGQLSGGQQQRVFIARALCQQADLYFFDEPFVGIDITTEEKIVSVMQYLASQNKTLLVVHHDLSTVNKYFSHLIMINQRLIAHGERAKVFTQENITNCFGPQLTMLHNSRLI